jgi:hypothetical protein
VHGGSRLQKVRTHAQVIRLWCRMLVVFLLVDCYGSAQVVGR